MRTARPAPSAASTPLIVEQWAFCHAMYCTSPPCAHEASHLVPHRLVGPQRRHTTSAAGAGTRPLRIDAANSVSNDPVTLVQGELARRAQLVDGSPEALPRPTGSMLTHVARDDDYQRSQSRITIVANSTAAQVHHGPLVDDEEGGSAAGFALDERVDGRARNSRGNLQLQVVLRLVRRRQAAHVGPSTPRRL
jgi:hypothetical protein